MRPTDTATSALEPSNATVVLGALTLPADPSVVTTPQSSTFTGIASTARVFGPVTPAASPFSSYGNAFPFDGSSYVSIPANVANIQNAFAIDFKWRTSAASTTANEELVARYSSDTSVGAGLFRIYNVPTGGAARLVAQWRDAGGTVRQIVGPGNVAANTNHDVAMSYDGTTMRLYRDGTLVGSLASTVEAPDSTTEFTVGEALNVTVGKAQSTIDEVRFSNTARGYTGASITPPTAPFTSDANTVILLHLNSKA